MSQEINWDVKENCTQQSCTAALSKIIKIQKQPSPSTDEWTKENMAHTHGRVLSSLENAGNPALWQHGRIWRMLQQLKQGKHRKMATTLLFDKHSVDFKEVELTNSRTVAPRSCSGENGELGWKGSTRRWIHLGDQMLSVVTTVNVLATLFTAVKKHLTVFKGRTNSGSQFWVETWCGWLHCVYSQRKDRDQRWSSAHTLQPTPVYPV